MHLIRIGGLGRMAAIDLAEVCGCACRQFVTLEGECLLEALTVAERVSRRLAALLRAERQKGMVFPLTCGR